MVPMTTKVKQRRSGKNLRYVMLVEICQKYTKSVLGCEQVSFYIYVQLSVVLAREPLVFLSN